MALEKPLSLIILRQVFKVMHETRSLTLLASRLSENLSKINTVQLRRTIYLTIQSSVDFEECVHKLLKLQIPEKMWKGIFESHPEPLIELTSRNVSHDCGLLWTE